MASEALSLASTLSWELYSSSRSLGWKDVSVSHETCPDVCKTLVVTYGNGKVIATSELSDFANASERSTHDNGVVAVLLVVVENGLHGLDTRVLFLLVLLLCCGLEPVENAADEGGDEESTGLGGGDGLDLGEEESQVAVDLVVLLEDLDGLDTLVGRGNLDEDAGLVNAQLLVEL